MRTLIETATREKRFRPRVVRIDSTVIEADVRYPTDADLASPGVKVLAREGRKLARLVGESGLGCGIARGRWAGAGSSTRTIRQRPGEAKAEVLALTEQTGKLLERSVDETRKLAQAAKRRARGCGAMTRLKVAVTLEALADRCAKVARQIRQRAAGETISDRIVSLSDPDARSIRKKKLGKPNEFWHVSQLAEVTEHTRPGARGLIMPSATQPGNPGEDTLLPDTIAEL